MGNMRLIGSKEEKGWIKMILVGSEELYGRIKMGWIGMKERAWLDLDENGFVRGGVALS